MGHGESFVVVLNCDDTVAHQPSLDKGDGVSAHPQELAESDSPVRGLHWFDDRAALAAHRRQPEGTVHQLLTDDPEGGDEVEAERNRQRMLAWRKKRGQM